LHHVKHRYLTQEEKQVWNTINENDRFGHGPRFNPVLIPEGATPDPANDAHFVAVDRDRQVAWDM